jgi:hypothetical protein
MEFEKILQQFKKIQPDKDYSASSRRIILATASPVKRSFGVVRFIFSNIQSASAIALTSFLLVLIFGGFSIFKFLNPLRLSSLDPAGLHAEADAIDMQLQVAGVTYDATRIQRSNAPKNAPSNTGGTSTPAIIPATPATKREPAIQTPGEIPSVRSESTSSEPSIEPSASTSSVPADSVFSALDILSN